MLRLLVVYGPSEQTFAIPEGEAKLGSSSENDLVVRIPGVSRRHALVRRALGGVEVVDRGSKNGLFVEGRRVRSALLTPGLRLQIGAARLEVEEISSSEEALALMVQPCPARAEPHHRTVTMEPEPGSQDRSPADAALLLAYHVAQVGVGRPGRRADLLVRIRAVLDADALLTFEQRVRGNPFFFEHDGELSPREFALLSGLTDERRSAVPGQVFVRRQDRLLAAGRESWFLAAKLKDEHAARETWRKDLLRFLAYRFFLPIRCIDDVDASEARRVLELVGGNKRRTAALLGISPGKLYKLLSRTGRHKR